MKHFNYIFPLFAVLFLLSSCGLHDLDQDMDSVFPCSNVDQTSSNVRTILEDETGVIREVDFWLPVTGDPTKSGNQPQKVTMWVIYPEAFPDMILKPCNLPQAQLIPNSTVSLSGLVLNNYESGFEIGGVTPFMLTEITGGEDGPDADGC